MQSQTWNPFFQHEQFVTEFDLTETKMNLEPTFDRFVRLSVTV